jgi:hypothetical protein
MMRSLVTLLLLLSPALAMAQTPPKTRPPVTLTPVQTTPKEHKEPSGVFGAMTIVDPATGEHFLPPSSGVDPLGYILRSTISRITVVFVDQTTGAHVPVVIAGPGAAEWAVRLDILDSTQPTKYKCYQVAFEHDPAMSGPPVLSRLADTPGDFRTKNRIKYNPTKHWFYTVELGPYRKVVRDTNGHEFSSTVSELTRRTDPLPTSCTPPQ